MASARGDESSRAAPIVAPNPLARVATAAASATVATRAVWLVLVAVGFLELRGNVARWGFEHIGGSATAGTACALFLLLALVCIAWMHRTSVIAETLVGGAVILFAGAVTAEIVNAGRLTTENASVMRQIDAETIALERDVVAKLGGEGIANVSWWRDNAAYFLRAGRDDPDLAGTHAKAEVVLEQIRYCRTHLRAPPTIVNKRMLVCE
jgi:hypothetical protein